MDVTLFIFFLTCHVTTETPKFEYKNTILGLTQAEKVFWVSANL